MNLARRPIPNRESAFTMVELALSIAVVAFAIVAIIGVMPLGLNAQKDNREDTIINQDAQFLLEAIRTGNVRVDELTNYVDFITVTTTSGPSRSRSYYHSQYSDWASLTNLPNPITRFTNGTAVIGMLSLPKYERIGNADVTNYVVAQMRALSGSLFEKPSRFPGEKTPTNSLESSFRYRLTSEVIPIRSVALTQGGPVVARRVQALRNNLYDVRLTFQWPVHLVNGRTVVGNGIKTYRTQMAGRLQIETNSVPQVQLEYLQPDRYALPATPL
jgi:type II secretory pathway pseudopilin PulG